MQAAAGTAARLTENSQYFIFIPTHHAQAPQRNIAQQIAESLGGLQTDRQTVSDDNTKCLCLT